MISSPLKTLLLAWLVAVSLAQKSPTILCMSQCTKFNSNNPNVFTNSVMMAKNLTQTLKNANSVADVVNSFGNYTFDFKQAHLLNLVGYKEIEKYRRSLGTQFGNDSLQAFIDNSYPDGTCRPCSSDNLVSYGTGQIIYPSMMDDHQLQGTLEGEVSATPGFDFPIFRFPYFNQNRRRLQHNPFPLPGEGYVFCADEEAYLAEQAQCFLAQMEVEYKNLLHSFGLISPYDFIEDNQQHVRSTYTYYDGIGDSEQMGHSNMLLNILYRDALLSAHDNCANGFYDATC